MIIARIRIRLIGPLCSTVCRGSASRPSCLCISGRLAKPFTARRLWTDFSDLPIGRFLNSPKAASWLLLIEFLPWSGLRKNWIAGAFGFCIAVGLAFALALIR
jgi:hypothetical protein